MEAVGYDMYLKLLSEAVSREEGRGARAPGGPGVPGGYAGAGPYPRRATSTACAQRLDVYRRIAEMPHPGGRHGRHWTSSSTGSASRPPAVKGLHGRGAAAEHRRPSGRHRGEASRGIPCCSTSEKLDMAGGGPSSSAALKGRVLLSAPAAGPTSASSWPGKEPTAGPLGDADAPCRQTPLPRPLSSISHFPRGHPREKWGIMFGVPCNKPLL